MTDEFQIVRETAAESAIWRAAVGVITSVSAAWQHSAMRNACAQHDDLGWRRGTLTTECVRWR